MKTNENFKEWCEINQNEILNCSQDFKDWVRTTKQMLASLSLKKHDCEISIPRLTKILCSICDLDPNDHKSMTLEAISKLSCPDEMFVKMFNEAKNTLTEELQKAVEVTITERMIENILYMPSRETAGVSPVVVDVFESVNKTNTEMPVWTDGSHRLNKDEIEAKFNQHDPRFDKKTKEEPKKEEAKVPQKDDSDEDQKTGNAFTEALKEARESVKEAAKENPENEAIQEQLKLLDETLDKEPEVEVASVVTGVLRKTQKPSPQKLSRGWKRLLVPGFPEESFMVNDKNDIVDRYTGRLIRPFTKHRQLFVNLRNIDDKTTKDFKLEELWKYVEGRNPEETKSAESLDFVYITWIDGIPKTKYKVYRDGRIWNNSTEEWMAPRLNKDTGNYFIDVSAGDIASRCSGVRSYHARSSIAALVWKAFHPEYRDRFKMQFNFKDGNHKNFHLDNLEPKRV
jgi:hypothetical protein